MQGSITTVSALVQALAQRGEAAGVVVYREGKASSWSGAALSRGALRLASGLAERNVGEGDTVAVAGDDGVASVILRLALGVLGCAALPLSKSDDAVEAALKIKESKAKMAFAAPGIAGNFAGRLGDKGPEVYRLDPPNEDLGEEVLPSWQMLLSSRPVGAGAARPDSPLQILSWAAGRSGNVVLRQQRVLATARFIGEAMNIKAGERVLVAMPLDQAAVLTGGLLAPLVAGATVILSDDHSAGALAKVAEASRPDLVLGSFDLAQDWLEMFGAEALLSDRRTSRWQSFKRRLAVKLAARGRGRLARRLYPGFERNLGPNLRGFVLPNQQPPELGLRGLRRLGLETVTGFGPPELAGWALVRTTDKSGAVEEAVLPGVHLNLADVDQVGVGTIELRHGRQGDWKATAFLGHFDAEGKLMATGRREEHLVLGGRAALASALERHFGRPAVIKEIAVFVRDEALLACIVPDFRVIAEGGSARVEDVLRVALTERALDLPSAFHIAGTAILRKPLPRDAEGILHRNRLSQLYDDARGQQGMALSSSLSSADQALLAVPEVKAVWEWLQKRYPKQALGLDFSPQLDLEIDSLDWLSIGMELEQRFGVRMSEQAMSRMTNLREFMRAVQIVSAGGSSISLGDEELLPGGATRFGTLNDEQRYWISKLGFGMRMAGAGIFFFGRWLMQLFFDNKAIGAENLPKSGGYLIAVNHVSDLDPLVVAATFSYKQFRRNYWSGEITRLFGSGFMRFVSRSCQIFPLDERQPGTSMAYAKAVLERGDSLVWFPESWRSRRTAISSASCPVSVCSLPRPACRWCRRASAAHTRPCPVAPACRARTTSPLPMGHQFPRPISFPGRKARRDYAGIAAALRTEVEKLPGGPEATSGQVSDAQLNRRRRASIFQRLAWLLEAGLVWSVYGLFRCAFGRPRLGIGRLAGAGDRFASRHHQAGPTQPGKSLSRQDAEGDQGHLVGHVGQSRAHCRRTRPSGSFHDWRTRCAHRSGRHGGGRRDSRRRPAGHRLHRASG